MGIVLTFWKANRKAIGVFLISALTLSWKLGWIDSTMAVQIGGTIGLLTGIRMIDGSAKAEDRG